MRRRSNVVLVRPAAVAGVPPSVVLEGHADFPGAKDGNGVTAVARVQGSALAATLSLDEDGALRAVLEFTLPANTSLRQVLPHLPIVAPESTGASGKSIARVESVLHTEPLDHVRMIFRTHADPGSGARAGLGLRARWRPSSGLVKQGSDALELEGHVVLSSSAGAPYAGLRWDGEPPSAGLYLQATLARGPSLWLGQQLAKPAFRIYTPLADAKGLLRDAGQVPVMAYVGGARRRRA